MFVQVINVWLDSTSILPLFKKFAKELKKGRKLTLVKIRKWLRKLRFAAGDLFTGYLYRIAYVSSCKWSCSCLCSTTLGCYVLPCWSTLTVFVRVCPCSTVFGSVWPCLTVFDRVMSTTRWWTVCWLWFVFVCKTRNSRSLETYCL